MMMKKGSMDAMDRNFKVLERSLTGLLLEKPVLTRYCKYFRVEHWFTSIKSVQPLPR